MLFRSFGEKPEDVNAFASSIFYAVDRYASYMTDWRDYYQSGGVVLSDRYTTSNAVHQGAKLPPEEQPAFFDWLYDLEYVKLGLPRPDLVIFLDVDLKTSEARMRHRQQKTGKSGDIHERDTEYLQQCLDTGHSAAKHYGWRVVDFMKDGFERAVDEKHEEIFSIIKELL